MRGKRVSHGKYDGGGRWAMVLSVDTANLGAIAVGGAFVIASASSVRMGGVNLMVLAELWDYDSVL